MVFRRKWCPVCADTVVKRRPRDLTADEMRRIDPERLAWSHHGNPLCSIRTSSGWQPAMPVDD